jgi:molybdopterin/thiamine biosynthesis adenylyltransferase
LPLAPRERNGKAGREDDLANQSVLIIGVGGLGVPAACALARGGAAGIGLVDPDSVALSNLPRQVIYGDSSLGRRKVEAAAERLREDYPGLAVETYPAALDAANAAALIGRYGFVIDATDDPAAKFLVNDTCVALGRPFVYAGVLGMSGQAMTVIPGRTACLRCLFEEPPAPGEIASCRDAGILGPVAAVIGEIEAAEALRWLRGAKPELAGTILTYNAGAGATFRTLAVSVRAECRCASAQRIGTGAAAREHTTNH